MAFVVPKHLPRAAYGHGGGHGSSTSYAEPVLQKLAEATRESLTADQASKWVEELQKNIDETKVRVHRCIHKDLPTFEHHLTSARQIQSTLEEITEGADGLTDRVTSPQLGLLPTVLTTLSAHSTLAQATLDAKVLHNALVYLARCRDEFKALSTLVEDGHLPAAVRKADEAQSLVQSAPRPLERSGVMKDLSGVARVLGDRVQEQLGDAYSRAIAVTTFPTGVTVAVKPHVTIRDSNGVVTLSELFTSLNAPSLQERLGIFRKELLSRAVEAILTKPSRVVVSAHEATLTIDHVHSSDDGPFERAHEALQHAASLITFIHDMLFPSLPSKDMFATQLAGPLAQALVKNVLRPSIPRTGSLEGIPDFLKVSKHAAQVEESLFKMGLRSGDIREWAQSAPTHYERRRKEDLVQHVRETILEHDGRAVAVTRPIVRKEHDGKANEEEGDPWGLEQSVPADLPKPKAQTQPLTPPADPYTIGEPNPSSPPEDTEADGWGFDDEEPKSAEPAKPHGTAPPQGDTSEDEPDVEVYAGTSQSEGATSERSGGTSHPTELLSAPHSDAEVVNATQSSEESDPWDDPWGEQEEEAKAGKQEPAPTSPSKSPAPTVSPTKAPESLASLKPAPQEMISPVMLNAAPAVVETPPSPAPKTPAPRVARGLERFAQKNRGSPSPTPSKFSSPVVSNSSPSVPFPPASATQASSPSSSVSPSKPNAPLPNPQMSPPKRYATPPAPFSASEAPKIAAPVTPAMRRAQQQSNLASQRPASPLGATHTHPAHGTSGSSPATSPTSNRRNMLQQDNQSSVGSASGLFGPGGGHPRYEDVRGGYAGSDVGSQVGSQVGIQARPESPVRKPETAAAKEDPTTETYMVSKKAQNILALAEDALKEGKELVTSNLFPLGISPAPGTLVLGCIPSFFDLFRALVPVAHGAPMAASAGIAMRFSNDCIYLSEEIAHIIKGVPVGVVGDAVCPKLLDTQEKLKVMGETWFEEVLENEKRAIADYLEPTEGFTNLQDQARYQECRRAVTRCTQAVAKFSRDTKLVLSVAKYYLALSTLVEDILSRVTEDILAMHDIPKNESHRLHGICKLMHSFEALFVPDGEAASMVTQYVPSWFKYSYLSELLEASLADIRHLFGIGALIDFAEEDLAHLIRALFSDSPKRQELIDRVLAGHPARA